MSGMQSYMNERLTYGRQTAQRCSVGVVVAGLLFIGILSSSSADTTFIEPEDIAPFEVVYEVGNHLINAGTAQLQLTREADLWTYRLSTTPRGILKLAGKGELDETSTIRLAEVDGKLQFQPQSYQYRQDNERRRAVDATFDWAAKSISYKYRNNETTEKFDDPIIDRLTATLLMMDTLRDGEFESTTLKVFDTGRIKDVEFINTGAETLTTPLGNIDTIRIINQNASGGSRQTTTWFAPSLDFVPVKIEHRKRGELVARLNLLRLNNRLTDIELQPTED